MADSDWVDDPAPGATKAASATDEWVDAPAGAAEEPPGLLSRAAKYLGTKGAHAAFSAATLGGALDPVWAGVNTAQDYVDDAFTGGMRTQGGPLATWKRNMAGLHADRQTAFRESPLVSTAATVGSFLVAPTPAPLSALAPQAAGFLPLALRGAAGVGDAALVNAGVAGASNLDTNPVAAAKEAAQSKWNLLGLAPSAVEGLGMGAQSVLRRAKAATSLEPVAAGGPMSPEVLPPRRARPTASGLLDELLPSFQQSPASKRLEELGVKNQTIGQMAGPNAPAATLEEISMHKLGGEGLKNAREVPLDELRHAVIKRASAPGAAPPEPGPVHEQMDHVFGGFTDAYGKLEGVEVYPAIHANGKGVPLQGTKNTPGAFDDLLDLEKSDFAKDAIEHAGRIIRNQMNKLPGGTERPGMVQPVDVSKLLDIRSKIRMRARKYGKTDTGRETAEVLDKADDIITQAIESQIPDEMAQHLRATDAKYREFKIVEDAVNRGGDTGEFTMPQLSRAVQNATDKGAYARGAADGGLGEMGRLGREVLTPKLPGTGLLSHAISHVPGLKWTGPMVANWMNTPKGREYLLKRAVQAQLAGEDAAPVAGGSPPSRFPLSLGAGLRRQETE